MSETSHIKELEKQLHAIRQERDQLLNENIKLKQHIASIKDDAQAINPSGMIDTLRRQRDDYRVERDQLKYIINLIHKMAQEDLSEAEKLYDELTTIYEGFSRHYEAREAAVIHNALIAGYGVLDTYLQETPKQFEMYPEGAAIHGLRTLTEAMWQYKKAGTLYSLNLAVKDALAVSGSPEILCVYILQDLRQTGEIDIIWLQRIGSDWLQANLKDAPAKIETIKDLLELAQAQIASGLTVMEFSVDFDNGKGIGERTVERALSLYKSLDQVTMTTNSKFGGFLADEN